MKIWIGIFIFLISGSISSAEIYKWTDENGRVHYGERPQSENSEKINIKKTPPSPQTEVDQERKETQQKLLESMEEERLEKKQKRAEATQEKQEQKLRCAELEDQYKRLLRANRYKDEDGNYVNLDETVLQREKLKLEEEIEKICP